VRRRREQARTAALLTNISFDGVEEEEEEAGDSEEREEGDMKKKNLNKT